MRTWIVNQPANKPYLNTGHRWYLIGSQDGLFPERGEHLPYEMWGVWMPPIKILNGFWFLVNGQLVQGAQTYEQLPYGSKFVFQPQNDWKLQRFQFIPQEEKGMVVEAELTNLSSEKREFRLELGMQSNLMPVWLAERAGIEDGKDEFSFDSASNTLTLKDASNPWTAKITADTPLSVVENATAPVTLRESELKTYCQLRTDLELASGESKKVTFFFAASEFSEEDATAALTNLKENSAALLQEKLEAYQKIDETAVLHYEKEPRFEEMYIWNKYINDWIVRKVSGIGEGVVAGYAEFPWWFGNDTNYIAPALLMQGDYESCKNTLRLVRAKSEEYNGNGRVVHEISSNGIVYFEGMTTETPQFADTVWDVYRWSGDRAFLEEMYDFCVQGMNWVEESCVDGLPVGYGISEIAGLDCFCCDTALLAIRGFEILSLMSAELGKEEAAAAYRTKKENGWVRFQKEFYMPEYGVYGDMVATKEEIIPRAETWKYTLNSFPITEEEKIMGESSCKHDKSPEDAREKERLKKRMEGVIAEAEQMEDGSRKAFHLFGFGHSSICNEFGYLQGAEAEALYNAVKTLSERDHIAVENMMPIGLGREITGFGNMKRLDLILENIRRVEEGFGKVMPGATNEIYPEQGCFVQSWNSLVTMWPYANSIFGIRPNAYRKTIRLNPCVGPAVDGLSLENLPIGGACFTFTYEEENGESVIKVKRPSAEWTVELDPCATGIKLVLEG